MAPPLTQIISENSIHSNAFHVSASFTIDLSLASWAIWTILDRGGGNFQFFDRRPRFHARTHGVYPSVIYAPRLTCHTLRAVTEAPCSTRRDLHATIHTPRSTRQALQTALYAPRSRRRALGAALYAPRSTRRALRAMLYAPSSTDRALRAAL